LPIKGASRLESRSASDVVLDFNVRALEQSRGQLRGSLGIRVRQSAQAERSAALKPKIKISPTDSQGPWTDPPCREVYPGAQTLTVGDRDADRQCEQQSSRVSFTSGPPDCCVANCSL
jgi:hypothetical protein